MTPALIPWDRAVYCAQCDRLSDTTGTACAGCGSTGVVALHEFFTNNSRPAGETSLANETRQS